MQSSRSPPSLGSTPSPTDRTNAHILVPRSFNTSESIPPSPHFFAMNTLTDRRLTGSAMPYQPIDHHPLSRYAHLLCPARHCIVAVDHPISYHTISAHQHTNIPYRGSTPRHGIPLCWTQPPREPAFHLTPHPRWHDLCEYRMQHLRAVTTTSQCGTRPYILLPHSTHCGHPSPSFLTCRLPMWRPTPNSHLLPLHAAAR
jgi:hypothetical protein